MRAWGDPGAVMLPRSSSKMLQALPLVTSGAADAHGLTPRQLALACASHQGAPLHVGAVNAWLADLGLQDDALRCGPQPSRDSHLKIAMIKADESPCQVHNNCSGKHTGFLTLTRHLGAGPEYLELDHPVQRAVLDAFEDVTQLTSPGYGIDGCSAPNFATTMQGMARAMAFFASAQDRSDAQSQAAARLTQAMIAHPDYVAGEQRACTDLMRAAQEPVALKTGAEGYFIAILPDRRMGLALKIVDGATRASECALVGILCGLGVLDSEHPVVQAYGWPRVRNWRGIDTGALRPAEGLMT